MRKLVLAIALCSIVSVQAVAHTVNNELSNIVYEQETKGDKYAILVQSIKNLRSSIMTGSEIKKTNPKADFQIVIMGQMVQELNNKELRSELDAANKAGIKLVVCEFALKVYGVTLNDLPLYFIGTPNAHKYMFQLQENDYNTLSI
ncbi:hypothetical protein HX017_03430 [Myroides marinus]|uniref:DsrE/DsrF-like family protein n=1 Tax=Myroides marinus TaxID=703342 RepID=A0A1H6UXI3_9FLAO|nr:hypothetical protein [Myroides marinus]KUF43448.1 hypothetical protein AS361_11055 [Myroides marinus]MDM1346124.1 hypothetical protein [Myroides marinus]MDM1351112.1 hypothetical protein [Myroides marinus]MDM1353378.1 hypothetical protein [Myroides marinus]MDM1358372.1 hypothetical protein [Myroides marinus]